MTYTCTRNGVEHEFTLDFDELLQLEAEDPEFSVVSLMQSLGERFRLTTADRITRLFGMSYRDFIEAGFTVDDLVKIYEAVLSDLGFRSAKKSDVPSLATSSPDSAVGE